VSRPAERRESPCSARSGIPAPQAPRRASRGRSRGCTASSPSTATRSAASRRTALHPGDIRRSARDHSHHLPPDEQHSSRVVLGGTEDRWPSTEPLHRRDTHRQAARDRIDLAVAGLVDDDPLRVPDGIDPAEGCRRASPALITEVEPSIGHPMICEAPAGETAPRAVNAPGSRTSVAPSDHAAAHEERNAPAVVANAFHDRVLASRLGGLGTTSERGPHAPYDSGPDPGHLERPAMGPQRRREGWWNRAVNQSRRGTGASQTRERERNSESAEGRCSRPSAECRGEPPHPHASLRTPLNLLCERKLSTHSLVP
jgi:hypothetical protein